MERKRQYDRLRWQLAVASEYGPTNPQCRHVLLTLALDMNESGGKAWPSQETLARRTGLNVRVVRRWLGFADKAGWIERTLLDRRRGKNWKFTSYQARIPASFPAEALEKLMLIGEDRESAASDMDRTNQPVGEDKSGGMVRTGSPTTSSHYFSQGTSTAPKKKLSKAEMERRIRLATAKQYERESFEKEHPEMAALIRERGWNYLGHARERDQLGPRINELLGIWSQAA